MFTVFVIGNEGISWTQNFETEKDAIDYAEYLELLHFQFVSVQDPNEKEILRFENE